MPTTIEAQGQSVDEAIQIALNQLGVSRDKVEIEILHHPRKGVFGIGARRAKVRATVREGVMLDGEEFDMSGGTSLDDKPRRRRRRGGGRTRGGRDGGDQPETKRTSGDSEPRRPVGGPEPQRATGAPGGGRDQQGRREGDSRREGDRRGGRRGGGAVAAPGAPAEGEANRGRGAEGDSRSRDDRRGGRGRGDQRGGEPRGDGRERSQQPRERQGEGRDRQGGRGRGDEARPGSPGVSGSVALPDSYSHEIVAVGTPPLPVESRPAPPPVPRRPAPPPAVFEEVSSEPVDLEAVRVKAEELVIGLLSRMGFAAEVSSSVDEAAGEAVIMVRSESEGLLIGRRGQTLDSLEHIVNRMVLRGEGSGEGRVLLDIGDYRRRRRESLDELATRLRTRAVGERRTVQVSPMSPRDRKFFAQAFAGNDSVEIRTLGAGFYRRVIVAPAGMGAAALAAAEAAGDGVEEETVEVEAGYTAPEAER